MSDSVVEYNYNVLRNLYTTYTSILSCTGLLSTDVSYSIDDILSSIEQHPITWKYYIQQQFKFSHEFEDLIIFKDSSYINRMADR